MGSIRINGNDIDLDDNSPTFLASPIVTNFVLLKTRTALSDADKTKLNDKDIIIEDYFGNNAYLCFNPRRDVKDIHASVEATFVGPYMPDWKIHAALKLDIPENVFTAASSVGPARGEVEKIQVTVLCHKTASENGFQLAQELKVRELVDHEECTVFPDRVVAKIGMPSLQGIASNENVKVIEKVPDMVFFNNICRDIVYDNIFIRETEKTGAGQVLAIADSGFDTGRTDDVHPAFKDRVLALYQAGMKQADITFTDGIGHGTHVCGTALGDGRLDTMASGSKRIRGAAPGASLVLTRMLDPTGVFYAGPLGPIFSKPYSKHHACIQNCSWGTRFKGTQEHYSIGAGDIDSFVYQNPEVLICFAAGNDGQWEGSKAQIGAQASAKNCLTVGACHSARKSNDKFAYDQSRTLDDTPTVIAGLSSRGPTLSGRIKPDVVAPGVAILSTATRQRPSNDYGFGSSTDEAWAFMSGTSMASPIVAGCAAILRQVLQEEYPQNPTDGAEISARFPSAALMKAILINGAVPLPSALSVPNGSQGFGRLNLNASITAICDPGTLCFRDGLRLRMGELSEVAKLQIPQETAVALTEDKIFSRLKVTLTWTESDGDKLYSILHLIVKFKGNESEEERHGNKQPGDQTLDDVNNVQQVDWRSLPGGTCKILVSCSLTTLQPAQLFAITWSLESDI